MTEMDKKELGGTNVAYKTGKWRNNLERSEK